MVGPGLKSLMPKHTLQIATLGPDTDPVLVGIRTLPVHKLYLVHLETDRQIAQKLRSDLSSVLKVEVETHAIPNNDILTHVLEGIAGILSKEKENYEDVIFNVTSGEKLLGCAALSAAFVNGLKAVAIMNGEPMMLPVLKFSYDRLVSQTKLDILKALQKKGGEVESLEELKELTGYGKPLLSYHIQGAEDSQGLVDLGLVEVKRGDRGRSIIQETTLGRLLTLGR
jgi:DNA-binding transcriptional ArsR family regulator